MGYALATSGSLLAETGASFDSLDPPSAFKARKLADGRVLVEDVPVFAETEARYTPDGKLYAPSIGLPWLRGAFDAFARKPGYWAPLHGDHHSGGGPLEGVKDRERFGEFRARSVRLMRVDGALKWAFTADYLFDDEDKAKKSNRFPYQSVEIVNEKPDEINSVALLSDKAPFVRFPNRRVDFVCEGRRVCYATAEDRSAVVWQSFTYAPDEPAPEIDFAAFGSPDQPRADDGKWGGSGSGSSGESPTESKFKKARETVHGKIDALHEKTKGRPLTREEGDEMGRLTKASEHINEGHDRVKSGKPRGVNASAFAAETEDHVADDKMPDEKKDAKFAAETDEKKSVEAAPAPDVEKAPESDYAKRFETLEKGMGEMRAMVAKLTSAMSMNAGAGTPKDGGSIDQERKETDTGDNEEEKKKNANAPVVAAQVQLAAEVDTLKARLEGMERAKKHDELYVGYAARLEPFGLTTGRKQRLATFVAQDLQFGTSNAELYVADTEARGERVSRPVTERGPGAGTATSELPVEIRAYAAQGANALAWAQTKLADYRALEAAGCTGDMTLAAFVKQSAEAAPRS